MAPTTTAAVSARPRSSSCPRPITPSLDTQRFHEGVEEGVTLEEATVVTATTAAPAHAPTPAPAVAQTDGHVADAIVGQVQPPQRRALDQRVTQVLHSDGGDAAVAKVDYD